MIYTVALNEKQSEIEWLNNQKIYPGCTDYYDWSTGKHLIKFGVIVSPEAALSIKLRHKLDKQELFKQK